MGGFGTVATRSMAAIAAVGAAAMLAACGFGSDDGAEPATGPAGTEAAASTGASETGAGTDGPSDDDRDGEAPGEGDGDPEGEGPGDDADPDRAVAADEPDTDAGSPGLPATGEPSSPAEETTSTTNGGGRDEPDRTSTTGRQPDPAPTSTDSTRPDSGLYDPRWIDYVVLGSLSNDFEPPPASQCPDIDRSLYESEPYESASDAEIAQFGIQLVDCALSRIVAFSSATGELVGVITDDQAGCYHGILLEEMASFRGGELFATAVNTPLPDELHLAVEDRAGPECGLDRGQLDAIRAEPDAGL